MKNLIAMSACILLAGAALPSANADTSTSTKGPPKTMGDEGKLPATRAMSDKLPEMRGENAPNRASDALSETGSKRMGDEGRLPATGAVSGTVPKMNAPRE